MNKKHYYLIINVLRNNISFLLQKKFQKSKNPMCNFYYKIIFFIIFVMYGSNTLFSCFCRSNP
jgi:hypothetical protein